MNKSQEFLAYLKKLSKTESGQLYLFGMVDYAFRFKDKKVLEDMLWAASVPDQFVDIDKSFKKDITNRIWQWIDFKENIDNIELIADKKAHLFKLNNCNVLHFSLPESEEYQFNYYIIDNGKTIVLSRVPNIFMESIYFDKLHKKIAYFSNKTRVIAYKYNVYKFKYGYVLKAE